MRIKSFLVFLLLLTAINILAQDSVDTNLCKLYREALSADLTYNVKLKKENDKKLLGAVYDIYSDRFRDVDTHYLDSLIGIVNISSYIQESDKDSVKRRGEWFRKIIEVMADVNNVLKEKFDKSKLHSVKTSLEVILADSTLNDKQKSEVKEIIGLIDEYETEEQIWIDGLTITDANCVNRLNVCIQIEADAFQVANYVSTFLVPWFNKAMASLERSKVPAIQKRMKQLKNDLENLQKEELTDINMLKSFWVNYSIKPTLQK